MPDRTCLMDGCDRKVKGRGLCAGHYWRMLNGRPLAAPFTSRNPMHTRTCSVDGCDRSARSHEMCNAHAERARRGIPVDGPIRSTLSAGATTRERLYFRAVIPDDPDACWGWTGRVDAKGYGRLTVGVGRQNARTAAAHRVSWAVHVGPIPDGLWVLHRCDNPPCANPRHLFLGDSDDNIADMIAKARNRRGEDTPNAILRDDDAIEILRIYADLVTALAQKYNVTPRTVRDIIWRRSWRHLSGPKHPT